MNPYGSATQTAIAALSRLAEVYDGGDTRLSASEIAESRGLQRPYVAKVLSTLSQVGIVVGSRGPGGGFSFAKDPIEVKLYDVYRLFEREDQDESCPFGGGICGVGDKCPLHDKLVEVNEAMDKVLHETTFDAFREAYLKSGESQAWRLGGMSDSDPSSRLQPETRRSYRASKNR